MRSSQLICGLAIASLPAALGQTANATNSTDTATKAAESAIDDVWHSVKYFVETCWWKNLIGQPGTCTVYGNSNGNGNVSTTNETKNAIAPPGPTEGCLNSPDARYCWTDGYNINTNFFQDWPWTGKTRTYSFSITNTTAAPDGVERQVFLVNDQYPGPTIYADWGDWVEINVINQMQDNGSSLHFHGARQWYTNAEDGVPGVTECPIAPNHMKVYRWQATQHGTSWYHSHQGTQYGDGILGPIVINGPATANYDIDLGPLPFTDWYYETSSLRSYRFATTPQGTRPPLQADTGLINGTMVSEDGKGPYSVTNLKPGKKHRLRLINTASQNNFMVSLDNHNFTVIAADFVPIEPYNASWLFVAIGQRYDVIIDADQDIENYWFRVQTSETLDPGCGINLNNGNIKAIFRYEGAEENNPTTQASPREERCREENIEPYLKTNVPSEDLVEGGQLNSSIQYGVNSLGSTVVKWGLDTTPINVNWSKPTLEYVWEGNDSFPNAANVITLPGEGEWVYFIIQEVSNPQTVINITHPIHLHGHDFYVLGKGLGAFSSTNGSTLSYENPPKRDTAMLPGGGWLALAFQIDNPGSWLLHCHTLWHSDEGMGVQFLEMMDQIEEIARPVYSFEETCRAWQQYYPENAAYVRDADDSGI